MTKDYSVIYKNLKNMVQRNNQEYGERFNENTMMSIFVSILNSCVNDKGLISSSNDVYLEIQDEFGIEDDDTKMIQVVVELMKQDPIYMNG